MEKTCLNFNVSLVLSFFIIILIIVFTYKIKQSVVNSEKNLVKQEDSKENFAGELTNFFKGINNL